MRRASKNVLLWVAGNLCLATHPGVAQDLLITNARIVVGNGETIAEGSISVAAGFIVSVSDGTFPPAQDGDRAQAVANAGVLSDAGVSLAFGTDQQRARPYPQAVLGEARALAEVMTPEQVIAVLTRNAAEFLNLGEELGTLEAGKYADMVILDGDPLADISLLANVAVVVQAGRIVVDAR